MYFGKICHALLHFSTNIPINYEFLEQVLAKVLSLYFLYSKPNFVVFAMMRVINASQEPNTRGQYITLITFV